MLTILIMGIVLLLAGILLFFVPSVIIKLNQAGQKYVFGEGEVIKHRIQTAILLLITGVLMVLMYVKWGE